MTTKEINILRELAKQYAELAERPENTEREQRMRRNNALIPGRPIVWIDEIPWHEMDIDKQLMLKCEDPKARKMEWFFREKLFRWKYFQADMVLEKKYRVNFSFSNTGYGFGPTMIKPEGTVDIGHTTVAGRYVDQLDTEEKLDRIKLPARTPEPEKTREDLEFAKEVLGDILPVQLSGNYCFVSIWDEIAQLRGVEPLLMDLYDNPELMHKAVQKFVEIETARIDQLEEMGLFSSDIPSLASTPPYVDELNGIGAKNTWFRGTAQVFSSVSPAMHEEFELDYIRPIAERFGLTYYGCCEPLQDRIDKLRTIKNLRKIGVSAMADIYRSAEEIGGDFVYARKPNPALVAGVLNEDAIRKDIRETVEVCLRNHCPYEFVLKDITTVNNRPGNLIRWNEIVQQTLDEYY